MTMPDIAHLPEPLLIEDAHEEWWVRPQAYRDMVNAWLASESIDVADLVRVEVYLVDAPFARLTFRVRDEDGKLAVNEAGDGMLTRSETALLSSLPPLAEGAPNA
jgi:hypothetical protein